MNRQVPATAGRVRIASTRAAPRKRARDARREARPARRWAGAVRARSGGWRSCSASRVLLVVVVQADNKKTKQSRKKLPVLALLSFCEFQTSLTFGHVQPVQGRHGTGKTGVVASTVEA